MTDDSSTGTDDPRDADPRDAERIDPKTGRSDDPRVDPGAERRNTDDDAWANDLTEENMPPPDQRDDAAHTLKLDPT